MGKVAVGIKFLGQPEVPDVRLARRVHKNIARLEVPVKHTPQVREGNSLRHFDEQANAVLLGANAEDGERKALAIAMEREQVAVVAMNRAKVVEAEAQVPLALAEALRTGRLGAMDYYRMQNLLADTSMRKSLGGPADDPHTPSGSDKK